MVKNTQGGSGHKGQARKFSGKISNKSTRYSQDEYEYYAQVIKLLGGSMCHVMGLDEKLRLCQIRGKFRGRSMRDNMIRNGTWVLVGGRDYETESSSKLPKCDLLEVYSDIDKERLKLLNCFSKFIEQDHKYTNTSNEGEDVIFTNNVVENEYVDLIKSSASSSVIHLNDCESKDGIIEEDINFDDI